MDSVDTLKLVEDGATSKGWSQRMSAVGNGDDLGYLGMVPLKRFSNDSFNVGRYLGRRAREDSREQPMDADSSGRSGDGHYR